jgi:hypothetical protein
MSEEFERKLDEIMRRQEKAMAALKDLPTYFSGFIRGVDERHPTP